MVFIVYVFGQEFLGTVADFSWNWRHSFIIQPGADESCKSDNNYDYDTHAYQTTASGVKLLFFIYEKIHVLTVEIEKLENSLHTFDYWPFRVLHFGKF